MNKIKLVSSFLLLSLLPAAVFCAPAASKKPRAVAAKKKAPAVKTSSAPVTGAAAEPAGPASDPAVEAAKAAPPPDLFAEALAKLQSAEPVVRRQGASFLAQSRDPKAAPELVKALSDEFPGVRRAAVEGLGLLAWREASPQLSLMLTGDKDVSVRQQAAIALSYLADPASGPALVEALKDTSPSVRYAALHTMGVIKYMQAEDSIIELLDPKEPAACRTAISALGMLRSAKAVPAVTALLDSSDQQIRLEAARALGEMGDRSAAPQLQKRLAAAERPAIRVEAAFSLAKMGIKDGLPVAQELVKSSDLSLKSQALNVITAVGDERSLALLEELYAAEQDPAAKSMLDLARQRLISTLPAKP